MWDCNRTERKALLVAAVLIGLAALGRLATGSHRGDSAWVAEAPGSSQGAAAVIGTGASGGAAQGLRADVEVALRREERALTPLAGGETLDPNRAAEEELRRLPGIGPARARAILDERRRRGFESPEALLRVPGIGPATYARIAPFVTIETPSAGPYPRPRRPTSGGCGSDDRVDANAATETELRALPGIGPVLARRIVRSREDAGAFTTPEALLRVSGIGPRLLERLRPRLCLSGG